MCFCVWTLTVISYELYCVLNGIAAGTTVLPGIAVYSIVWNPFSFLILFALRKKKTGEEGKSSGARCTGVCEIHGWAAGWLPFARSFS